MAEPLLIGIDAGTSVIKAVAFTAQGDQVAAAALPNQYVSLPDGGAEQDMAATWDDTAHVLRLLGEKIPDLKSRAMALAVTGQGDGTWLIDKAGEPVAPAWLWLDARAAAIAKDFEADPAYVPHFARTGMGVTPCQQYVQLAWLKRNRPEVLIKSATALHCKDWLYFKLTGVRATDPSEGNFTYGRFDGRTYQPDVLDTLGVGEAKSFLPPMVDGSIDSHPLSAAAAAATGLAQGLPVCLGYVDVVCTGLGGGLFDVSGQAGCTIVGSTGMHMRMRRIEEVKLSAERSGMAMCLPYQSRVAQIQSNMASTLNIDWLLDLALGILKDQGVTRARADLLKGLDARILAETPGRLIYHPYISHAGERGPFLEPAARAGFAGLEQGMGYAALMGAVFEGLCHAARDCYSAMGPMPSEVRLTGGAARSQALRLMMASALGAPVRSAAREEAGAAGAVMMAAVQQKIYPDMAAAVAHWVDPLLSAPTLPDTSLVSTFNKTYPLYREMREFLPPVWRQLKDTHA